MTPRTTLAAALVAAVLAPAAAAHGGGGALGYHSTVTSVRPATPAVHVAVAGSDDRLQLRVDGNARLTIDGYEKEPYLRFDSTGVYRNARSPATYLNDDRYGDIDLPDRADPDATPEWVKVEPAGHTYEWHDHRIHWMSTTYPPAVAKNLDVEHHIFDWTVPGTLNGAPITINGTLDYRPLPGRSFPAVLIIPLVLLVLGGIALVVMRNRRAPE